MHIAPHLDASTLIFLQSPGQADHIVVTDQHRIHVTVRAHRSVFGVVLKSPSEEAQHLASALIPFETTVQDVIQRSGFFVFALPDQLTMDN